METTSSKGNQCVSNSEKPDRKTVERNRRIHMKRLCSQLISHIPPQHFKPSKEILSQQDQLDQATTYIKELRGKIEVLKRRMHKAQGIRKSGGSKNSMAYSTKSPVIEIKESGSCFEVVLISGLRKNFTLHEVIGIVEEEGAEVVSANFSRIGENNFHTIHGQVKVTRLGMDASRIYGRLQKLVS